MLRKMYNWCVAAAGKPHATWTLGTVSFVESSFFPIPPDAMLLPMSLARPDRAYHFATVCTLTSVAGGILGYAIGYYLYELLGLWLMQLYGYGAKIEWFQQQYREWGAWFILIKGLTPIPYKLVTIVSGFAHYPILPFILLSFAHARHALLRRGVRVPPLRRSRARDHREASGTVGHHLCGRARGRDRRGGLPGLSLRRIESSMEGQKSHFRHGGAYQRLWNRGGAGGRQAIVPYADDLVDPQQQSGLDLDSALMDRRIRLADCRRWQAA